MTRVAVAHFFPWGFTINSILLGTRSLLLVYKDRSVSQDGCNSNSNNFKLNCNTRHKKDEMHPASIMKKSTMLDVFDPSVVSSSCTSPSMTSVAGSCACDSTSVGVTRRTLIGVATTIGTLEAKKFFVTLVASTKANEF